MRSLFFIQMFTLSMILMSYSCGSGGGSGSSSNQGTTSSGEKAGFSQGFSEAAKNGAFAIASKADLWACEEKTYRQLVYVEEEATFYTCSPDQKDWIVISIKGDNGAKGDQGVAGANGAKGAKGDQGDPASNLIQTVYRCAVDEMNYALVTAYKGGKFSINAKISERVENGGGQECSSLSKTCRIKLSTFTPAEYYDWTFLDASSTLQTHYVKGCGSPSTCYDITTNLSCDKISL